MPESYFGTPESRERDARFVGHEWKGDKMTDRVDRDVVAQVVRAMEWAKQRSDGLVLSAEENVALLAERDALKAKNQRFREALISIASSTCCDRCQEAALVARTALAEQEKTDDQ